MVWSPTWRFLRSLWWLRVSCHPMVLVQCFIKSKVNTAIFLEVFQSTSFFHLLTFFYLSGDADFLFQQHLSSVPKLLPNSLLTIMSVCWFASLTWTSARTMLYCQKNAWPENPDQLKPAIKATWASISHQQCHKLITSMLHRINAVTPGYCTKEPQPSTYSKN